LQEDVGAHDDRRVSHFEVQQKTYILLQIVLMGMGRAAWALGVAVEGKARALSYQLGAAGGGQCDGARKKYFVVGPSCFFPDELGGNSDHPGLTRTSRVHVVVVGGVSAGSL